MSRLLEHGEPFFFYPPGVPRSGGKRRVWQDAPMVAGAFAPPLCETRANAPEGPSCARIADIFAGVGFPASGVELKEVARKKASEQEMRVISQFGDQPYRNMSDVAKELGRVLAAH